MKPDIAARRPLAVFGLSFLACMLAAVQLAGSWPVWLAALCAAGLAAALLRKRLKSLLPILVLAAATLALLVRTGYDALAVAPIRALAGREAAAEVLVVDVQPGYGGGTVNATVRVTAIDGEPAPNMLKVQLRSLPEVAIGDRLSLGLRFYPFANASTAAAQAGRGYYMGASASGPVQVLGNAPNWQGRLRLWQYALGDSIREKLPLRLSSVAAAMAVGDRRTLAYETTAAYRAAGLSHVLVVSGLHMAVVSGAAWALLRALLRRRKKLAAALSMLVVLGFMALTGFSLSVVRSGVACLLVLAAPLFGRRADAYTSLGLAALVLCLQNPYAAADVGLLLSFTATLGALLGGEVAAALRRRWREKPAGRGARLGRRLALLPLTPLCVTAATLPVLVWAGIPVTLASVPMNILVVPLLGLLLPLCFLMALPAAIATVPALLGGAILALMERLAYFCQSLPGVSFTVTGGYALAMVLAVYLLVFWGVKTRRVKAYSVAAGAVLAFGLALHFVFSAGTVSFVVAGGGASPSLVVTRGGQAVVVYRSRLTAGGVQTALQSRNVAACVLFVDLRLTAESTEYESRFAPAETLVAADDVVSARTLQPMEGVTVYVVKQGGGMAAVVEVDGYRVGLVSGSFNLAPYPPLDVLVAGQGTVSGGGYAALLAPGAAPDWADENARLLQGGGEAEILLRPGVSVRYREVQDGWFD